MTEGREPGFTGILGAGKEVDYALLFLIDALHPLHIVGYTFSAEDTLPIAFVDLYLVLDRGCVLKLGFLGGGNELLDIIPTGSEDRSVIRYRIIRVTCGGYAGDDGKLALLGAVLESGLQIRPRIIEIEQRNVLHITGRNEVLPVGKEYFFTRAISSGGREATVAGFLAKHGGDACAILG